MQNQKLLKILQISIYPHHTKTNSEKKYPNHKPNNR